MKKIEKLQWLISDLLDLKDYYEQLERAIILENKETIENIKKCINDFDKNAMIIKLIEILERGQNE